MQKWKKIATIKINTSCVILCTSWMFISYFHILFHAFWILISYFQPIILHTYNLLQSQNGFNSLWNYLPLIFVCIRANRIWKNRRYLWALWQTERDVSINRNGIPILPYYWNGQIRWIIQSISCHDFKMSKLLAELY